MTQLVGKVAVVTGAGRPAGLGAAIVTRLASAGCLVVLSDVGKSADPALPADMIGTDSEMERVAAAIRAHTGAHIATFSCDVRDPARVDGLGEFAVRTFGTLDIWVN